MNVNPNRVSDKLRTFISAWAENAPEAKFSQMSLEEFKAVTAASRDSREELYQLRMRIKGLLAARNNADIITKQVLVRVAAGVIADPAYGINSGLYRGMNFVTQIERASGLVRKTKTSDSGSPSTN